MGPRMRIPIASLALSLITCFIHFHVVSVAGTPTFYRAKARGWNFIVFGCNSVSVLDCLWKGADANDVHLYFTPTAGLPWPGSPVDLFVGMKDLVFATKHSKLRYLLDPKSTVTFKPQLEGIQSFKYMILVNGEDCNAMYTITTMKLISRGVADALGNRDSVQQWYLRDIAVACTTVQEGRNTAYNLSIIRHHGASLLQLGNTAYHPVSDFPRSLAPADSLAAVQPDSLRNAGPMSGGYGQISELPGEGGPRSPTGTGGSNSYGQMSGGFSAPVGKEPTAGGRPGSYGIMSIPTSPPPAAAPAPSQAQPAVLPGHNFQQQPPGGPAYPALNYGNQDAMWSYQKQIEGMRPSHLPIHLYNLPVGMQNKGYADGKAQGCTVEEFSMLYGIMCDLLDNIMSKKHRRTDLIA